MVMMVLLSDRHEYMALRSEAPGFVLQDGEESMGPESQKPRALQRVPPKWQTSCDCHMGGQLAGRDAVALWITQAQSMLAPVTACTQVVEFSNGHATCNV